MTATRINPETIGEFLSDSAVKRLSEYFSSGRFTGGQFERFAGGGDRGKVANQFTSDDIVAVSLLGVRIPGRASLELLDNKAEEFNELLREIPSDVDIWEVGDDVLGPTSPAAALWSRLEELPGAGWVTAGKLLARKRPRLIPVYDRVVKLALQRSDGEELWRPLRDALRNPDDLRIRLSELRSASEIDADISLLRVLDVAIWMAAYGRPEPVPDSES